MDNSKFMLKKAILIFILISALVPLKLSAQSKDCSRFKNGTFTMKFKGGTEVIERYGRYQRETVVGTKIPLSFIVTWVDDCHYTLKPMPETYKHFKQLPKNDVMLVSIIKTTESSYIQESSLGNVKLTGEMIKIK
jgi:cytochrome oxidase Cu insertion factor (SCO1/SenC/PrrC family)